MHREPTAPALEVDESMWLYLACTCEAEGAGSSGNPVAELCRSMGWHVHLGTGATPYGPDALLHADAYIADLSCASDEIVAELAVACSAGRPILALRAASMDPPVMVERLLAGHEHARIVTFSEPDECLARVREVFADGAWRAMLRAAIPVEDA